MPQPFVNTCYPGRRLGKLMIGVLFLVHLSSACAQNASELQVSREHQDAAPLALPQELPDAPQATQQPLTVRGLPERVLHDELHFVQFGRYISRSDLKWLIPLAGATVAAFALDEKTMSEVVSSNPAFNQTNRNVSDGLRDGFIAVPVVMLGLGTVTHDAHTRDAGLLASEAMIDAYAAGEIIKLATFRERPNVDHSEGSFYRLSAGTDSSFVSGHSLAAWSSAAVLAQEYPGRWKETGIYTLAAGVSVTRVLGQEHFPSDVLLGSAAGWLIGHYVFVAHHRRVR